jgi:hypothetical protein
MPHSFKLSRRIARFRAAALVAVLLSASACGDSFDPETSTPADITSETTTLGSTVETAALDGPSLATSYAGGIAFGLFALPNGAVGDIYNGVMKNIWPKYLRNDLATIKSRGGKVALMFAGPEKYYKNADGTFSFTKWKARIDMYKNIEFDSYIADGTVIGHYLIDEPQDRNNWAGTQVSQKTLEEMARYSKQLWPNMVTIVRTWPDYLDDYSGSYQYLDAAWAQYAANRFPNAQDFINSNVSKAKAKGLALVVGLNLRDGSPTRGNMSASQVKSYGTALLSNSYPCAFLSWKYDDNYLSTSAMRDAMRSLRNQAENRATKSCRGS